MLVLRLSTEMYGVGNQNIPVLRGVFWRQRECSIAALLQLYVFHQGWLVSCRVRCLGKRCISGIFLLSRRISEVRQCLPAGLFLQVAFYYDDYYTCLSIQCIDCPVRAPTPRSSLAGCSWPRQISTVRRCLQVLTWNATTVLDWSLYACSGGTWSSTSSLGWSWTAADTSV